ncbi:hypothetical protein BDV96DRAFT_626796 [Lophiotrema nucula]|uniref:Uncharacterized protein n=1 Tax=Lophiotrema nucula TaxID=690887 RepID=A0A6A5ZXJ3_9PLEO|nr:hypothetical protein BDV96DRAFT_626796 [Lophiotrema nucula]
MLLLTLFMRAPPSGNPKPSNNLRKRLIRDLEVLAKKIEVKEEKDEIEMLVGIIVLTLMRLLYEMYVLDPRYLKIKVDLERELVVIKALLAKLPYEEKPGELGGLVALSVKCSRWTRRAEGGGRRLIGYATSASANRFSVHGSARQYFQYVAEQHEEAGPNMAYQVCLGLEGESRVVAFLSLQATT